MTETQNSLIEIRCSRNAERVLLRKRSRRRRNHRQGNVPADKLHHKLTATKDKRNLPLFHRSSIRDLRDCLSIHRNTGSALPGNNTNYYWNLILVDKEFELAHPSRVPSESEEMLGILLFGVGMGLLMLIIAPSSGGVGFIVALVAGLLLAGGLDLIVHRTR